MPMLADVRDHCSSHNLTKSSASPRRTHRDTARQEDRREVVPGMLLQTTNNFGGHPDSIVETHVLCNASHWF